MALADEVKAVMESRKITAYQISKDTGIDQATMSRFFSEERPLVKDSLLKLLDYLGYELTIRRKNNID